MAGLRADALDLHRAPLSVIRTVTEVAGHTAFKPYPRSAAGRRTVPLPPWLVAMVREHMERWPAQASARYTRRTDNGDRILRAFSHPHDEDPDDGETLAPS